MFSHVETSGLAGVMHATFEPSHLTLVENTVLSDDRTVGTGPSARTFKEGAWLVRFHTISKRTFQLTSFARY